MIPYAKIAQVQAQEQCSWGEAARRLGARGAAARQGRARALERAAKAQRQAEQAVSDLERRGLW